MKKFVEKMKRFWSLDAKTSGGFTLVELIVVIAILAILAGIAVPAYSGYVEKARKAEDEQLLATINTAFAAACIENGTDVHSVYGASFDEENMAVTGTITLESGSVDAAAYNTAFQTFFAGNEDAEFSTIEVYFDAVKHAFSDTSEGTMAMSYGGGIIYINAEDAEKLAKSTFNGDELGVAAVLDKVDSVSGLAMGLDSDALGLVLSDDDFMKNMIQAMGGDVSVADIQTEFGLQVKSLVEAEIEKRRLNGEDIPEVGSEEYDELFNSISSEVSGNMAVVYAAQNATEQSSESINELLNSDNLRQNIINTLQGMNGVTQDPGKALGDAALIYGMYTAYAYATNNVEAQNAANSDDPTAIFDELEKEGELDKFQEYIESDQGQLDLDGYFAAMNMINGSTGDENAVADVLVNGFNNQNLSGLLQQVINK